MIDVEKHNKKYYRDRVLFWAGGVALWIYVLFFQ